MLSISHAGDDIEGGKAKIKKVFNEKGYKIRIKVKEDPGAIYYWDDLMSRQSRLKITHGDNRARRCKTLALNFSHWYNLSIISYLNKLSLKNRTLPKFTQNVKL